MRFGVVLFAGLLVGCDAGSGGANGPGGIVRADAARQSAAVQAVTATPDGAFDYRYAFRLPGGRIEAVQESHARGCDQLGPARCRITAMRYAAGDDGAITAILTMKLDPAMARAFGKAATQTVMGARGVLTDAEVAGADSIAANGRGDTVVSRLRDALSNTEAALRGTPTDAQRVQLAARAERLRTAVAAIAEVDAGGATSVATAPVIFTYTSGGAIPGVGGSPDATFDVAGETFLASLAGLLVVLASIGPWVVLLLGGALVLRWVLARTTSAAPTLRASPRDDHDPHGDINRNVIQRWFARDDAKEHETAE